MKIGPVRSGSGYSKTAAGVMKTPDFHQEFKLHVRCFHCGVETYGLGRTLKEARDDFRNRVAGWSAIQFDGDPCPRAYCARCTPGRIADYESGKRKPGASES